MYLNPDIQPKFKSGDKVKITPMNYGGPPQPPEHMTIIAYYPPTSIPERLREQLLGPYYRVQLDNKTLTYRHERRMEVDNEHQ